MKLLNLRALRWRVFAYLGLLCIGSAQAQVSVENVRAVTKDDSTRLVLETSDVVAYRKFHLSSPDRLVIDLRDTSTQLPPALFELDDARIANVRAARRGDGVRLVFDLTGDILQSLHFAGRGWPPCPVGSGPAQYDCQYSSEAIASGPHVKI